MDDILSVFWKYVVPLAGVGSLAFTIARASPEEAAKVGSWIKSAGLAALWIGLILFYGYQIFDIVKGEGPPSRLDTLTLIINTLLLLFFIKEAVEHTVNKFTAQKSDKIIELQLELKAMERERLMAELKKEILEDLERMGR